MRKMNPRTWQLVGLPGEESPLAVTDEQVDLLLAIGARLHLSFTKDQERRELRVSHEESEPLEETRSLRYPTGWAADVVDDEDAGADFAAVDPVTAAPLIRAFPDAQLSKSFRLSDFRPGEHSYDYIRISPRLVAVLEDINARAGRPVTVISGYRPAARNLHHGSEANGTHVDGLAADICCDGLSSEQLYEICQDVVGKQGGVGLYPAHRTVHVDLRGYEARWCGL